MCHYPSAPPGVTQLPLVITELSCTDTSNCTSSDGNVCYLMAILIPLAPQRPMHEMESWTPSTHPIPSDNPMSPFITAPSTRPVDLAMMPALWHLLPLPP